MTRRVVIVVEGGLVQYVACDDPKARVLLFDYDSFEDPEKFLRADYPFDAGPEAVERYLEEARRRVEEERAARLDNARSKSSQEDRPNAERDDAS